MATKQTQAPVEPKEVMRQNLGFLREYAKVLLVEQDETITALEDEKEETMEEYLRVGQSFRMTERDLAFHLFNGILPHA